MELRNHAGLLQRGPRPLRLHDQPWGISHRSVRELEQVGIGARLLLRGLHLAILVALNGGAVLLEHPAEPWRPEAPAIWKTALVRMLTGAHTPFRVVTLQQWAFGAVSMKPTSLLAANVDIEAHLAQHAMTWRTRPSLKLQGRDALGSFYTAKAKEYPIPLCRAFASALHSRLTSAPMVSAEWADTARAYARLCKEFGGSMMPDYQPRA